MEVWQLILYAVASLLALRSLTSLMTSHRDQTRYKLSIDARQRELQRRRAEQANETAVSTSPE